MNPLHASLFAEHLETISFLQEFRRSQLQDRERTLTDVAKTEARIARHLSALVLGGADAATVTMQQIGEGDDGERYAALRLFCQTGDLEKVEAIESAADFDDEVSSLEDALRFAMPASGEAWVMTQLERDVTPWTVLWARAAAWHGWPVGHRLHKMVASAPPECIMGLLEALGWAPCPAALMTLFRYMQAEEPAWARTAALAGLRLRFQDVAVQLRDFFSDAPWAAIPTALLGETWAIPKLMARLKGPMRSEACIGLGIMGDIRAIEPLMAILEEAHEDAEAAAVALYLLTGAEPEISTDADAWKTWWRSNRSRFRKVDLRYRLGRRIDAATHAACLQDFRIPIEVRRWFREDIMLRHHIDARHVPDGPALMQHIAIEQVLKLKPA